MFHCQRYPAAAAARTNIAVLLLVLHVCKLSLPPLKPAVPSSLWRNATCKDTAHCPLVHMHYILFGMCSTMHKLQLKKQNTNNIIFYQ
jgi:hypothetical protein